MAAPLPEEGQEIEVECLRVAYGGQGIAKTDAGATVMLTRAVRFTANQLKDANFTAQELVMAGYTGAQIREMWRMRVVPRYLVVHADSVVMFH